MDSPGTVNKRLSVHAPVMTFKENDVDCKPFHNHQKLFYICHNLISKCEIGLTEYKHQHAAGKLKHFIILYSELQELRGSEM